MTDTKSYRDNFPFASPVKPQRDETIVRVGDMLMPQWLSDALDRGEDIVHVGPQPVRVPFLPLRES